MFGAKAQIAALEKGLDFELIMVAYDSDLGYSPKHPEVLRVNPKGQVPVLVHGNLEIFDSTLIFEYLEDLQPTPALWPRDIVDRARARRLGHQSDEVYFPHIIRLMGLQKNLSDAPAVSSIEAATAYYGEMEKLLPASHGVARSHDAATCGALRCQCHGKLVASGRPARAGIHERCRFDVNSCAWLRRTQIRSV